MAFLKTAAKVLPLALRRRGRDYLVRELVEWNPLAFVRSHDAELEVELDMLLSIHRRQNKDVFFLQVGAFDGISTDPIYPLIKRHALRGVLVEPQREFFATLKSNYAQFDQSRFTFVNAAIAETNGTLPIYKITSKALGPTWLHGIASLDRDVVMRHRSKIPNLESLIEIENVHCLTFASLFAEVPVAHVDLLQIDAEGHDGVILRLFDVPTRRPSIVRFEHKHLTAQEHKNCLSLLINHGYRVSIGSTDTLAHQKPYY